MTGNYVHFCTGIVRAGAILLVAAACGDRARDRDRPQPGTLAAAHSAAEAAATGEWLIPGGHCGAILLGDGGVLVCERAGGSVRWLPPGTPSGPLADRGEALDLKSGVAALFRVAPDTILILYRSDGAAELRSDMRQLYRSVSYAADLPRSLFRWPLGVPGGGAIVYDLRFPGMTAAQLRAVMSTEGRVQVPIELVAVGEGGSAHSVLATMDGVERAVIVDGHTAVLRHPLAERPLFAAGAGGVFVAHSHDGKVLRYAADGSITGEWQWPGTARNVAEDELERIRVAYVRDGEGPTARHREQLFAADHEHTGMPRIEYLAATDAGSVAIGEFVVPPAELRQWQVLNAVMRAVVTYALPASEVIVTATDSEVLTFDQRTSTLVRRALGVQNTSLASHGSMAEAGTVKDDGLCRPSAVPIFTLGMSEPAFAEVTDARISARGIAVLDGLDRRLRGFDVDGALLWEFGRRGSGPAEFELPMRIEVRGDTTIVADHRLNRFSHVVGGALIRTAAVPPYLRPASIRAWIRDSTFVVAVPVPVRGEASVGVRYDSVDVVLQNGPEVIRRFGRFPAAVRMHDIRSSFNVALVPWAPRTTYATIGDEFVVATGVEPTITLLSIEGSGSRTIAVPTGSRPITAAARTREAAYQTEQARAPDFIAAVFRSPAVPERTAAYDAVRATSSGELWIRHASLYSEEPAEYSVLSPAGGGFEHVTFDAAVDVLDASANRIVARTESPEGAPLIRVFERSCVRS